MRQKNRQEKIKIIRTKIHKINIKFIESINSFLEKETSPF